MTLEGHTLSPAEIDEVKVYINGMLEATIQDFSDGQNLVRYTYAWSPPEPGEYLIQVVTRGTDGTISEPDATRVKIGGPDASSEDSGKPSSITATSTSTPTPTATTTTTPTTSPTPSQENTVDFWADPLEIKAGGYTILSWQVTNVQKIIFGG